MLAGGDASVGEGLDGLDPSIGAGDDGGGVSALEGDLVEPAALLDALAEVG
jgi:hypothetical protein